MDIEIKKAALEDINNFNEKHSQWIFSKIEELADKPTQNKSTGLIQVKSKQVFKYVMKQGSKGGKDYRAIFDIQNGKIQVKAVFHRDQGYDKQMISDRL